MQNFKEMNLPQALFHRLEEQDFKTPTPIQAQAIPHALEGKDILGSAQTGTGKTAAYGVPLVTKLLENDQGGALVLLPTRELAMQVMKALRLFIGHSKIDTALLIGGEDMGKQLRQLRMKPRLIVGTPGRINDHLTRGSLKLKFTNFLVLDEVDRMLDMGFGIQLDAIAKYLTAERQTLMFTATMPVDIEKVAKKYLVDPIRISVDADYSAATKIKQEHIKLADSDKHPRLLDELNERQGSVIIFVKTKRAADRMAEKLRKKDHKVDALHGDLRQNRRNRVIDAFRKKKYRILVATDVAARGLDIPHIEHVINYDLPQCPEDYIHRIGRTGRAGAEGVAVSFLSPSDGAKWKAIQRLINPGAKPSVDDTIFKNNKKKPQGQGKPKRKTGGKWKGHWKKGKKAEEMEQEKDRAPRRENNKEKRQEPKNENSSEPKKTVYSEADSEARHKRRKKRKEERREKGLFKPSKNKKKNKKKDKKHRKGPGKKAA